VVADGGWITEVRAGADPEPGDRRLAGLVLPGLANAHSHAFHRALRGRTHDRGGTFWTWRERMYSVAARLHPEGYLRLARAAYAEMALAGVTAVGEFHYLHHSPGGAPYRDPNAMGQALIQAAADAGVRLTLLDTCYLAGGLTADGHTPPGPAQARFADADASAWAARVSVRPEPEHVRLGAAIHSVRAVPAAALPVVVDAARGGGGGGGESSRPLHVHVSEQPAENEACLAHYGRTPTALLRSYGVLGEHTTAVHATHLTAEDITLLGGSSTAVCACPSTEADLGDGIGPFRALAEAGAPLTVGSDQHAQIDLLAEARLVEHYERLAHRRRGRFSPAALVEALTASGQARLGWPDAGRIAPGRRADLVAIRLDTPRTAGIDPGQAVLAAGAPDVHTVIVDGTQVVTEGRHLLGDVAELLTMAITPLWGNL
jgi:formiminoglutamate deiminase